MYELPSPSRPLYLFSDRTAARFSDLGNCFLDIVGDGEFKPLDSDGRIRGKMAKKLHATDQMASTGLQLLTGFKFSDGTY